MATLFIVGNINRHTFANAALAAHVRAKETGSSGLSQVFVLHSPQSAKVLNVEDDWQVHLSNHGLHPEIFSPCTVGLKPAGSRQLTTIADHVAKFLRHLDPRADVFVDLTNGNSLYKSVMSNIAFVVGARRPFVIEVRPDDFHSFLSPQELVQAYVELPDPALLDAMAPAWLTEIRRFNIAARDTARTLGAICGANDAAQKGFELDVANAVRAWFEGAKREDGAALGGAVMHVGRAFEDLVRGVYEAVSGASSRRKKLVDMVDGLCSRLTELAPGYEPVLLQDVAHLLRKLRNDATHNRTSARLGRIRARLSTELLLATADYFRILYQEGLIKKTTGSRVPHAQYSAQGNQGEQYYFGLDGDGTGRELERLFQGAVGEDAFAQFSHAIDRAMHQVAERVKSLPINGKVLFASGDDILFTGVYDLSAIEQLRSTYAQISGGRTCSVGFGKTPREAYVALKMAKARPGKDSLLGIRLVDPAGPDQTRSDARPDEERIETRNSPAVRKRRPGRKDRT